MICGSIPVKGQEMFGTGIYQETEAEDIEEFQDSQTNDFETNTESDTESDTEVFSSDDTEQDFQDGETSQENTEGIRYIKGRPLTEEEKEEQLEPFKNLTLLDPGPEVESDLTSVYAAYGSRATAFPSYYDSRQKGLVTSVKDQHPFGTCWAFGMAASWSPLYWHRTKGRMTCQRNICHIFFPTGRMIR